MWKDYATKAYSSPSLSPFQKQILAKSNIGSFTNEHYPEILKEVSSFEPHNARQAEQLLISVMKFYDQDERYKEELQQLARSSGYNVDSLLYVAAISIKDRIIADLGFKS